MTLKRESRTSATRIDEIWLLVSSLFKFVPNAWQMENEEFVQKMLTQKIVPVI